MIRHHPSDELMLDYAAGSLGEASSLALATHLTLCPQCRAANQRLDAVGGNFFAHPVEGTPGQETLNSVMARISSEQAVPRAVAHPLHPALPQPLRLALGCDLDAVPWKRLGIDAYQCVISTRDKIATARLLRIPAGRPVPVHTHCGNELTLVLRGAFSDLTGNYTPGDFQEADDRLVHQPHAEPAEDCVCLAVTEAPLQFKSWAARIVQPFLGI